MPAWSPWAEVREDIGYGVQEWGILVGLHRQLHTRDPYAKRDLIRPVGPSPSSPWWLQGPVLPHVQQQGPALTPVSSFKDLGRGLETL